MDKVVRQPIPSFESFSCLFENTDLDHMQWAWGKCEGQNDGVTRFEAGMDSLEPSFDSLVNQYNTVTGGHLEAGWLFASCKSCFCDLLCFFEI